jgi:hypothetical protein
MTESCSFSFFELKAANAQLQQFFRMFEERKKHAFSDGYFWQEIDPMIDFIVEETNTIRKLGNILIGELEWERSKNLEITLENLELMGQFNDLSYVKKKMITHVETIKQFFDLNEFDLLRQEISLIDSLAGSAFCNRRFLFEVFF